MIHNAAEGTSALRPRENCPWPEFWYNLLFRSPQGESSTSPGRISANSWPPPHVEVCATWEEHPGRSGSVGGEGEGTPKKRRQPALGSWQCCAQISPHFPIVQSFHDFATSCPSCPAPSQRPDALRLTFRFRAEKGDMLEMAWRAVVSFFH